VSRGELDEILQQEIGMTNLDDLYKWFDENRDIITKGHEDEHVLLKDNTVVSYFPDDDKALEYAQKSGFTMGEFLIQECISKDEESMYYYNEAVSFG
jgi:phospholipase C